MKEIESYRFPSAQSVEDEKNNIQKSFPAEAMKKWEFITLNKFFSFRNSDFIFECKKCKKFCLE